MNGPNREISTMTEDRFAALHSEIVQAQQMAANQIGVENGNG
jgi:hypothetical protein